MTYSPQPDPAHGRPVSAEQPTTAMPIPAGPAFASPAYGVPTTSGARTDVSPSVTEQAGASADAGKQAVSDVAQTAADKAQDVAAESKRQARNVLSEAQTQLKDQAAQQHHAAVASLRSLADELSSMAKGSEQSGPATDLVGQAGDRAHSAASWLDAREPGQLVEELRTFARRRPGTFLLGALAAGVIAGRLTRGAIAAHSDDSDASTAADEPSAEQPLVSPPMADYTAVAGPDVSIHQNAPQYPASHAVGTPQAEYAPGTADQFGGFRR